MFQSFISPASKDCLRVNQTFCLRKLLVPKDTDGTSKKLKAEACRKYRRC